MSAYQLNVGDRQAELIVPEDYVLSGEVITV
jgi:hypothetical protein